MNRTLYCGIIIGRISIVLNAGWNVPVSDYDLDVQAAEITTEFNLGWLAHPIYFGDWPEIMKLRIAHRSELEGLAFSRLPELTPDEISLIKGTADFFCINFYSSQMVSYIPEPEIGTPNYYLDMGTKTYYDPSWKNSTMSWLKYTPFGLKKMLNYISNSYNNTEIFVTENGWADIGEVDDQDRIQYYKAYLSNLLEAILDDGVNVIGYTAWSIMDNFEFTSGYSQKFGLIHVDFDSPNRTRTWKSSGKYYKKVIQTRCLVDSCRN